jgi:hypothetical protein
VVTGIPGRHQRLDNLVNDIFGGDRCAQFDKRLFAHDLLGGLRVLRMDIDTHLVTLAKALALRMEQPGDSWSR